MRLELKKEKVQKEYNLEYREILDIDSITNSNNVKRFSFNMGAIGERIAFSKMNLIEKDEGELEEVLEKIKTIFDMIILKLDINGRIEKIANYDDIVKKWGEIKINDFGDITDQNRKNFIFEISKTINNELLLLTLIKYYNVFPFIFLGLYERNYSESAPYVVETIIHNIFPLTNIPVVLEIYGKEKNGKKILKFNGKERSDFDRFGYLDKLGDKYPELNRISKDDFRCRVNGQYVYDQNDVISEFDITLDIMVKGVVKYQLGYHLKEK